MVKGVRAGRVVTDPIGDLNQHTANEIDRIGRRLWPLELLNGGKRREPSVAIDDATRKAIFDAELPRDPEPELATPFQGDDYPIEMDVEGYPILAACLDRRRHE